MATIKDIAGRLGISVSAVSKGLNGASDISEELRQMVLDTAVEMGYATKRSKKEEHRKLCIFIENMRFYWALSKMPFAINGTWTWFLLLLLFNYHKNTILIC